MPVLKEKKYTDCSSLVKNIFWQITFVSLAISPKTKDRTAVKDKNRYRSASLTVEAAVALPLFFFSILIFWQCFLLHLMQCFGLVLIMRSAQGL